MSRHNIDGRAISRAVYLRSPFVKFQPGASEERIPASRGTIIREQLGDEFFSDFTGMKTESSLLKCSGRYWRGLRRQPVNDDSSGARRPEREWREDSLSRTEFARYIPRYFSDALRDTAQENVGRTSRLSTQKRTSSRRRNSR